MYKDAGNYAVKYGTVLSESKTAATANQAEKVTVHVTL
jgi:hypothetical protein